MVFVLLLYIFILSKLTSAVSVSMIPKSGTPPPIRDLPGFTLNEELNKLYIYGGRNASPLDDMWEFDLTTETWREIHYTSSIYPGPRSEPYLASLNPGEILLFGGNTKSGPVSDLWVFDIENQYVRSIQWNLVISNGALPPRSYYRATCYYEEDGRKYLAVYGGVGEKDYINTLFILDIETYTWTQLGNNGIPAPNIEGSRISYKDGSFYMLDSVDNGYPSTNLYRFDMKSHSWSIVDMTGTGIDYLQANGQCVYKESLYVIQGYLTYSGDIIRQMYRIDIESGNKASEAMKIFEFSVDNTAFGFICSEDIAYIFGGFTGANGLTNKLIKIQLSSYEVNLTELSRPMTVPTARYGHAMEFYDEKLYILGGKDIKGNELIDFYTFDLKTETWSTLSIKSTQAPSPRSEFAHTRIGEILIIYGGVSNNILLGDMYYFNFRTQECKSVEPKSTNNPTNRKGSCMAAAGDAIFIFGGITQQGYSNELWMFDSGKSTYILLKPSGDTPASTARGGCKAYIEENGDIIFETYLGETVGRIALSEIFRYNLSTNIWTSIKQDQEDMIKASQTAALYLEGKLLVAGGAYTDYFCKNEILIYDTTTQTTIKSDQTLPYMTYNAASVFYKNKLYIHGGGSSFQRLPLPDIPMNNLIVIDLEDECEHNIEICRNKCSPGTHYDNQSCIPCPMGTYQDDVGNGDCKKCFAGFYSDTEGADSVRFCKPCSQGTFNTQLGETMCYDCPSDQECYRSKIESNLYTNAQKFTSVQPELYETREDISILYSNYFNTVLGIVSFIVILHLLSFNKTRSLIKSLDLYQLRHNYEINKPVIKRKTLYGGLFTLIFISIALSIVFSNTLSMILDNITETKALVPLVALQEKYENFITKDLKIRVVFENYGGKCTTLEGNCMKELTIIMNNLVGEIQNKQCLSQDLACIVSFECINCELVNTGSISMELDEMDSYSTGISAEISSFSSIPDEYSTIISSLRSDKSLYFRGPNPSSFYFLMIPSLFLNDSGDWEKELKGYHVMKTSDPGKGSQIVFPEYHISRISFVKNLKVELLLEKSESALLTQRLRKHTVISFFSSLSGSILGMLGGLGFLMSQIEGRIERKKQSVQYSSLEKIVKSRNELVSMNIAQDLEMNASSMSEYSSDYLVTTPYISSKVTGKTYLDLNKFKMFDKLDYRREHSHRTKKVLPLE